MTPPATNTNAPESPGRKRSPQTARKSLTRPVAAVVATVTTRPATAVRRAPKRSMAAADSTAPTR